MPAAEGSLEIGEVDEGERRVLVTFKGSISHAENHILGLRRHGQRASLQELLDLLQLFLNRGLPRFEGLELLPQGLEFIRRPGEGRRGIFKFSVALPQKESPIIDKGGHPSRGARPSRVPNLSSLYGSRELNSGPSSTQVAPRRGVADIKAGVADVKALYRSSAARDSADEEPVKKKR